jgi:hypothetical protein
VHDGRQGIGEITPRQGLGQGLVDDAIGIFAVGGTWVFM